MCCQTLAGITLFLAEVCMQFGYIFFFCAGLGAICKFSRGDNLFHLSNVMNLGRTVGEVWCVNMK